ncbi:hypothetical protein NX021_10340 [Cytobacillus firmus]|nr:hypothetical protein [Cytobacillus firmus]
MSIAVLAMFAWLVMIVFAIVPKGLTLTEIVFMYFIIVILTITQFTILDVNLHWVSVTKSVEESFAIYICRFIVIPFQILMAVCVLNSHMKAKWRWVSSAAIAFFLSIGDRIYLWAGLITFHRWNGFYAAFMYMVSIVLVWLIARWFLGLEKGEFKKT